MRLPAYLILVYLLLHSRCGAPATDGRSPPGAIADSLLRPDTSFTPPIDPPEESLPTIPLDYDTTEWAELIRLDSAILLDLKYATPDNFVKEKMYDCPRCFLRPEVAGAVVRAHRQLQAKGYRLKMYDCYRPHPIQWKLWKKTPDPRFVTNPEKGSMHNRGAAVDLTLTDSLGRSLDMGSPYDHFGWEAYHAYTDLPDSVLQRRQLLKETMEAVGFRAIRTEWWHYSFQGQFYALSDMLWKCYE